MNQYLNLFKISKNDLETLIAAALSKGGSYADMYFEYTSYSNLMLKDSIVSAGGYHEDYGVGIRVLADDRTGYSYCESTDFNEMKQAALAAASIGAGTRSIPNLAANKKAVSTDLYSLEQNWRTADLQVQIDFLYKLENEVRKRDSRIQKVIARITNSVSDVLMYNSYGEMVTETRPMGSVSLQIVLNGLNNAVSRSFRVGMELLKDELITELADLAVKDIDARLQAKRPKGGEMPVVIAAGSGGILLHEAMGHAFEADFNRKGQSIFSDKMGKQICKKGINVVDDATVAFNRGSGKYDDEGVAGEKTYMVADGVLNSFLHDRISADYYGVVPTGNGRRDGFRSAPIPRMRASYMENGDCDPKDIIASVKKGVFVDEFSNGQVKIGEGDFTFFVKSGYTIENGKLTTPIKDINIIGNGPEALANISLVGNDLIIDNGTWTCGKEQSVPVSCGIPTVLVDKLVVGGE